MADVDPLPPFIGTAPAWRRRPELMTFRDLADALRFDPEVQRRFTEATEKAQRV